MKNQNEINFNYEYYKPMFEEGCKIWIDGLMPYLSMKENGSIYFTAPDREPVIVREGIPEHNYFCHNGCGIRLDYNRRTVKCKSCGYVNFLPKYLVEKYKLIQQSVLDNESKTNEILKNRRWENGKEVVFT